MPMALMTAGDQVDSTRFECLWPNLSISGWLSLLTAAVRFSGATLDDMERPDLSSHWSFAHSQAARISRNARRSLSLTPTRRGDSLMILISLRA